jgi:hypothetical protein
MKESPYLKNDNRLADVLSAIQVMSVYRYYKLSFAMWSDRISGTEDEATKWEQVFKEHPEFFRLDSSRTKASLVWRRNYTKRFDPKTEEMLSKEEFRQLGDKEKGGVSRSPLSNDSISILIRTAVDLHDKALARKQDKRWWYSVATGVLGLIVGIAAKYFFG